MKLRRQLSTATASEGSFTLMLAPAERAHKLKSNWEIKIRVGEDGLGRRDYKVDIWLKRSKKSSVPKCRQEATRLTKIKLVLLQSGINIHLKAPESRGERKQKIKSHLLDPEAS